MRDCMRVCMYAYLCVHLVINYLSDAWFVKKLYLTYSGSSTYFHEMLGLTGWSDCQKVSPMHASACVALLTFVSCERRRPSLV